MPKKPKRRPVKASRAASLKGWRTRRKMREERIADIGLRVYRGTLRERDWLRPRGVLDDMLPPEPTINRIPRPEIK